jgi:hypothetical protein
MDRAGWTKLVTGFEFAAIGFRLVFVGANVTIRPLQEETRPQRENNRFSIDVSFNAWAFGRGGQTEIQGPPEDHGIRFAHDIAGHRMDHFGFQQECGRV